MQGTLGQLIDQHGVEVLESLDRSLVVPVLPGLQFQGDLAVIPVAQDPAGNFTPVRPEGIAIIPTVGSGHEHRLLASGGTAVFMPVSGQDIGVLKTTAPAYIAHPEHGYLGIAPGSYVIRRQREQAQEERLVAD